MAKKSNPLLAAANILMSFSELVSGALAQIERHGYRSQAEITNRLRAEGLYLKNQLTAEKINTEHHRTAVTANKIVEGDQKIEKNELELIVIRKRIKTLTGEDHRFIAQGYPEPGDVRNGILPPED